jgi:inner membrane protein YidH
LGSALKSIPESLMDERDSPASGPAAEPINLQLMSFKMSADNALRSWTSMTISMISFGFAIYKILQQVHAKGAVLPGGNTPRNVGLFLIVAGTVGIVMGIVSYVRTLRQLRPLQRFGLAQPALAMALLIFVLGLVLSIKITILML